jgi:outer membrane protein OmpA-like peptidoglycan-associated protein
MTNRALKLTQHCANSGNNYADNDRLALQRANSVEVWRDRSVRHERGQFWQASARADDPDGRQRNRRVEIVVETL